ncbi:unnamed protein product [Effrenium voratum]|uniref:Clp R domain-containing protein n=1 Tax=Effrenium voratum TaxID=2562239 RepID=A0AA36HSP8_9DINO|nr:unnamed protein product [Effrenium voratum]CAJ1416184.1 unnamed protein product [Effrenium voratum]
MSLRVAPPAISAAVARPPRLGAPRSAPSGALEAPLRADSRAPLGAALAGGLAALRRARRAPRRAKTKEKSPDYKTFSDDLIAVLQNAEKVAQELHQAQICTDAVLLSLLRADSACPSGAAVCAAAFPRSATQAAEYVVRRAKSGAEETPSTKATRVRKGVVMHFTPMTARCLVAAQKEQLEMKHQVVEPAHLLLALLKEEKAESQELLAHLGQNPKDVERRVLTTLQGPLPQLRLRAADLLEELKASASEAKAEAAAEPSGLAEKLPRAFRQLSEGLVERSVETKLLLLAALSGEHLFLLGPPGTAKSLLARRLATVCRGAFFERLLTRFSVPEEIFGPLSLRALENDELRRKVEGFLPTADVAFLDEVFKANSSILNALLTLLNERRFDNGGERVDVPLWTAVAASNELPESDELEALFDRFLLRRSVPRVSDKQVPTFLRTALASDEEVVGDDSESPSPVLSVADSEEAQRLAEDVDFPEHLLDLIIALRAYLRDEAEPPVRLSDRRLGKAVRLLRLAASVTGASEVSELDLLLLQHMCWDKEPQQAGEVRVWLLERMSADGDADNLEKLTYFVCGVEARLRVPSRSAGPISRARLDIKSIRKPLEDTLKARQVKLQKLRRFFRDGASPRLFWLEPEDLEDAENQLLPRVEEQLLKAEETLRKVLELELALDIQEEPARDSCLDSILGVDGESEPPSMDEINQAAKRMPKDLHMMDT